MTDTQQARPDWMTDADALFWLGDQWDARDVGECEPLAINRLPALPENTNG